MKSILLSNAKGELLRVYTAETLSKLQAVADLDLTPYDKQDVLDAPQAFRDVQYVFSTWGMPGFTEEEIKTYLPNLKCVFYAAGSVQHFARPFLNCGVKVFSAWAANGVPVAEYTVAQIVLANKGFFVNTKLASSAQRAAAIKQYQNYTGNYEVKIGIIGAGMIGKMVIERLKNYHMEIFVFDPFLPEETAQKIGVKKVTLDELFASCRVVSNHLANNAQTQGMLTGAHFEKMLPYATFINTGRGAQVVEREMLAVLKKRPDLTAVLDVTYPEPPEEGSDFYKLENVFLTSHIAGSMGNEVHRMSEYMLAEFEKHVAGQNTQYEVTMKMLETMA